MAFIPRDAGRGLCTLISRLARSIPTVIVFKRSNTDKGTLRVSQMPSDVRFGEMDWVAHKVVLGEEVQALSYHPSMEVYVLGTSQGINFKLPDDDDFHNEWRNEGMPNVH